jgi:hypothetical protein
MSEKKDYFEYVSSVLGVKSILASLQDSASIEHVPLMIAVENYEGYSQAEKDLLSKMISALKIDLKKIKVIALKNSQNLTADFCVQFVDVKPEVSSTQNNLVTTHSPKFLLQNSDYKKDAWSDLQKVIAYFK